MEWTQTPLGGAAVSLLLGMLLGLERQRAKQGSAFAGIRTFPLFALCGFFGALAAARGIPLALPAVLLVIGGLGIVAFLRQPEDDAGVTTEITGLLAAVLGAVVGFGEPVAASAVAVVATLLLTMKAPLHRIAGAMTEDETLAVVKFALVAVVLLPLLPDRPVGPYGALVPRKIGLLVVLLSGISLAAYVLVKVLGSRAGWPIAGALGGLVSSTATTLSFASRARDAREQVRPLAVGVILASTVLYARGAVVIAFIDRELAVHLAPRLGTLFALGIVAAALLWQRQGGEREDGVALGNPVELGRAALLAAIFAVVILLARVAQEWLGTAGLWVVGALGGLVDVDSVAVAAARVRQDAAVEMEAAAGAYLLATVTNLVFKSAAVVATGGSELGRRVLPAFGALAVATGAILLVWR